jgi:hypothetical protein
MEPKVGDKLEHKYLKTIWEVEEVKKYKTNPGRLTIFLKRGEYKWKIEKEQLHMLRISKKK